MIAKEWRNFWWMFVVGALILLPILASGPTSYTVLVKIAKSEPTLSEQAPPAPDMDLPSIFESYGNVPDDPVAFAMQEMALFFGAAGKTFFIFIAAVLGVGLLSAESGRSTIFFLLSKPISRTHVLLSKYFVGATALLGVAVFFGVGFVVSAGAKGYPLESLDITGVALSVALLWLGSLSIFGLALTLSVVLKNLIWSAIAILALLVITWTFSNFLVGFWMNYFLDDYEALGLSADLVQKAMFPYYWSSKSLYLGQSLASMNFAICLVTAVLPLFSALWLFNRKAY
jgi:ABC-2 type transport system permease protein